MTEGQSPDDLEAQWALTAALRKPEPEKSLALCLRFINGDHGELERWRLKQAFQRALKCLRSLHDWPRMEALALQAVARLPEAAAGHRYLGEALFHLNRSPEALAALDRALELDPANLDARALREMAASAGQPPARTRALAWPSMGRFKNPRSVIERYLLRGAQPDKFIKPGSVFLALGSCFAMNLALRLRAGGKTVFAEEIGEDVNSTYANRCLLQWIEHGPVDAPTATMERVYGQEVRQRFRQGFEAADVVVLTLGVAPCFFHKDTGEFVFLSSLGGASLQYLRTHVMRTTTVAENVENLRLITEAVRRLSPKSPRIVLTVSPVPLAGSTEFGSVVVADSISKSILRVACHEALAAGDRPDLVYWPSYEIVRSLGMYFEDVFGAEDQSSRHVSDWLVDLIVELFVQHHSQVDPAPRRSAAP